MDLQQTPFTLDEFRKFHEGEESGFRVIYNYYQPILYRKICQFCRDLSEAEEITQEIFVQLFLKRLEIKSMEAVFPFLYTVAKRMAISSFRKRIVRLRYVEEELLNKDEEYLPVHSNIESKELRVIIDAVIAELPPQQQSLYRMNRLEEKSYDEIAELSGLSKYTVRNHLYLANKFVRFRLEKILFFIFFLTN